MDISYFYKQKKNSDINNNSNIDVNSKKKNDDYINLIALLLTKKKIDILQYNFLVNFYKNKGSLTKVNEYIKTNKLQNQDNKKKISPDKVLTDLLKIKDKDDLTYFSMQKYLKDHFPKEDTTVVV